MKKELIWWTGFLIVAFILIGQMTGYKFRGIDVQLYDTYYVLPAWLGFGVVLAMLVLIRGLITIVAKKWN